MDVVPVTGTWSLVITVESMAVHDAPVSSKARILIGAGTANFAFVNAANRGALTANNTSTKGPLCVMLRFMWGIIQYHE